MADVEEDDLSYFVLSGDDLFTSINEMYTPKTRGKLGYEYVARQTQKRFTCGVDNEEIDAFELPRTDVSQYFGDAPGKRIKIKMFQNDDKDGFQFPVPTEYRKDHVYMYRFQLKTADYTINARITENNPAGTVSDGSEPVVLLCSQSSASNETQLQHWYVFLPALLCGTSRTHGNLKTHVNEGITLLHGFTYKDDPEEGGDPVDKHEDSRLIHLVQHARTQFKLQYRMSCDDIMHAHADLFQPATIRELCLEKTSSETALDTRIIFDSFSKMALDDDRSWMSTRLMSKFEASFYAFEDYLEKCIDHEHGHDEFDPLLCYFQIHNSGLAINTQADNRNITLLNRILSVAHTSELARKLEHYYGHDFNPLVVSHEDMLMVHLNSAHPVNIKTSTNIRDDTPTNIFPDNDSKLTYTIDMILHAWEEHDLLLFFPRWHYEFSSMFEETEDTDTELDLTVQLDVVCLDNSLDAFSVQTCLFEPNCLIHAPSFLKFRDFGHDRERQYITIKHVMRRILTWLFRRTIAADTVDVDLAEKPFQLLYDHFVENATAFQVPMFSMYLNMMRMNVTEGTGDVKELIEEAKHAAYSAES